MDLRDRAKHEISVSLPYLALLTESTLNKNLRAALIEYAPAEFYSLLSQMCRHVINGTFCIKNKRFCQQHRDALYALASPEINLSMKKVVLLNESKDFLIVIKSLLV